MMSPEQIEQYHTQGFTKVHGALPPEDLKQLREHVDNFLAHLPEGQRPEHLDKPHLTQPFLMETCRHPKLLDLVEQLIGPDIVLFSSHMIAKAKGDGLEVPWHQDAEYWELEPMDVVTLWLAVDESVVENGCMRVIPGTQTEGLFEHKAAEDKDSKVLDKGLDISRWGEDAAVDIELQPGDLSFHAPYLVHGSTPNHSQKRRCGYTMRFMPASTKLVRDGKYAQYFKDWPLYLVRGEDRDGVNTYANA